MVSQKDGSVSQNFFPWFSKMACNDTAYLACKSITGWILIYSLEPKVFQFFFFFKSQDHRSSIHYHVWHYERLSQTSWHFGFVSVERLNSSVFCIFCHARNRRGTSTPKRKGAIIPETVKHFLYCWSTLWRHRLGPGIDHRTWHYENWPIVLKSSIHGSRLAFQNRLHCDMWNSTEMPPTWTPAYALLTRRSSRPLSSVLMRSNSFSMSPSLVESQMTGTHFPPRSLTWVESKASMWTAGTRASELFNTTRSKYHDV